MKENRIAGFFKGVGNTFGLIGTAFSKGDWKTKLSFIMVLVTKWVDKHTIPYTINNLSVLTP